MLKNRQQQLSEAYIREVQQKPKIQALNNFKGHKDRFWVYQRPNRMYPVPFKAKLPMNEINQIKYGDNTYNYAK